VTHVGLSRELVSHIDRLVDDAVEQRQAPGVVAAVARGDSVHVATAGSLRLDGPAVTPGTLWRITSMTKPMTAAVVLAQVDAGLLDLDEAVDRLLPELADRAVLRAPDADLSDTVPARRPITVRDLLTFTWGFGMQGAMFQSASPWPIVAAAEDRALHTFGPPQPDLTPEPDTWMARLSELPLLAQPGERWLYQSGSQVLGVLAARVDGAPFDAVLRERLFDPVGMHDTGFSTTQTGRLATAYERRDDQLIVSDPPNGQWSRPPAFPDGAGGLLSTADDLLAFARMLLRSGGDVLAPDTAAAMTRNQLTRAQQANVWPGFSFLDDRGWGYGLSVAEDRTYGWDGGFGTTWSTVPTQELTVVVLTQRATDDTGPPAICNSVLAAAQQHLV
jgi:CubicO group peptidase (beta-lactamase class C family)